MAVAAAVRAREIDGRVPTGWYTEDFTWAELSTLRATERLGGVRHAGVSDPDQFHLVRVHVDAVDQDQKGQKPGQLRTGIQVPGHGQGNHDTGRSRQTLDESDYDQFPDGNTRRTKD